MNETIQARNFAARHYAARQAALFQRSDLIESAENATGVLESDYLRTVNLHYEPGNRHGSTVGLYDINGVGGSLAVALTAGIKVMQMDASWPTTSPELHDYLGEFREKNRWVRWANQTKEALRNAAIATGQQTTAAARLRVDRLSSMQAAFGFTIQDLAVVLGITRPQLYKWLDATNEIRLQEASSARLALVERIAKEWSSRSNAPLGPVSKEPLKSGENVFAMLTTEAISEAAVIAAFDELRAKLYEKPKSRSQLLREAGLTRRPSVRSLPSDE
ncbi:MAG: hypothetical protein Q8K87_15435 [Hydrogenophaga sp.]|nr:hypothetical protein [Hydrogenophaga sp.]MDZ4237087.1 hypothetical protein [Hydrogenophaga sp.]